MFWIHLQVSSAVTMRVSPAAPQNVLEVSLLGGTAMCWGSGVV